MKTASIIYLSFLIFCLATAQQTPWPITLLIFSFFAFSLNYWLVPGGFAWRNHHFRQKLSGPSGWPILGILPQMGSLAHRKLAAMASSLNATRLMAFSLGTTRVVISSHPETAKEILSGSSFSDRPIKESARLLMFERAIGFAPAGNYWRNLRRIAANYMFSPRRISTLEPLRQRLADEMAVEIRKEMEEKGIVVLRGILQKGSLSNVLESVFGISYSCSEKEELLSAMVKEGYELITKFNLEDYFPLKFLDFYGVKRRCHELAGKVRSVVGGIVRERKAAEDLNIGSDFLSALLSLPEEEQLSESDMVPVLWVRTFPFSTQLFFSQFSLNKCLSLLV